MSHSYRSIGIGHLLNPLERAGGELLMAAVVAVFGILVGRLLARFMHGQGLHWSWAACGLFLLPVARAAFGPLALTLALVTLSAALHGRRRRREDLEAGMDLAEQAKRMRAPVDLARRASNRLLLARRRRAGAGGWLRAGELIIGRGEHGRLVSVPFGGRRGGTHTLLVGATGSGKTVTQTWIASRAIELGMGVIVLDPKGDSAMRTALAGAADRAGRPFLEWTPSGSYLYNPFARGSETEIADKALAGERFTEPHYLRQAQRYLGHVVRALRAAGVETSLAKIVGGLDPAALELLARELPEDRASAVYTYLDSLSARQLADLSGVRDRLSILVESDVGRWLEPDDRGRCFDLLGAVRTRSVVYFELQADRRPLLSKMLGAAIVQDLQTTVASLQACPRPTLVLLDEFSAIAAEHVVRLFARARSAGVSLVLSTQELSDLRLSGREQLLEQVLGNITVLLAHRQVVPDSAKLIASLAGSRGAWRTTRLGDGRITRTRTRIELLAAEDVMGLATGQAAAIVPGVGGSQFVAVFAEAERS